MTSFGTTNSVLKITDENNSFSISSAGHWNSDDGVELTINLYNLLELRSENDIDLRSWKRGTRIEIENSGYILPGFDHFKNEIAAELKGVKYRDLGNMVYRLQLTYDGILEILDVKFKARSTLGDTLSPGVYQIVDFDLMSKYLLSSEVSVKNDIRLKSNLNNDKTIRFIRKSFWSTFTESHSGVSGYLPGFVQLIRGNWKSDLLNNIAGVDKVHLKCDCISGSIVNGVREPILVSFVLWPLPPH